MHFHDYKEFNNNKRFNYFSQLYSPTYIFSLIQKLFNNNLRQWNRLEPHKNHKFYLSGDSNRTATTEEKLENPLKDAKKDRKKEQ